MKVLAPKTHPATTPVEARHCPVEGDYATYRACLRWDFSFSCGLCLLHEAEISPGGVEGTAATTIEHNHPNLRNVIANCVYACRFCNNARGTQPEKHLSGASLLNPRETGWASHFDFSEDVLIPRAGDADAEYTFRVYRLNDPRKVRKREFRRQLIESRLEILVNGPLWARKLRKWARSESNPEKRRELLGMAIQRRTEVTRAWMELRSFQVIPPDAPTKCRCGTTQNHSVPTNFAMVDVDEPAL